MKPNPQPQIQVVQPPPRRGGLGCAITLALVVLLIVGLAYLQKSRGRSEEAFLPILGDTVVVVRIEGPINESKYLLRLLKRLRENSSVKAIVLRLDTPGGAVGASEEIYREVLRARTENKKHVVASMGNTAASGGYYIAMAADEVFANSGTITGSIGVVAPNLNLEETLDKLGIKSRTIVSGEHKDTGSPLRGMSEEERALLQSLVYDMYRQFFTVVLKARHEQIDTIARQKPEVLDAVLNTSGTKFMQQGLEWQAFPVGAIAEHLNVSVESENALRRMADGRIFTGDQALQLGLIDKIGTLQDAIDSAAKKAGISGDPYVVERSPSSDFPSWLGMSAGKFWQEAIRSSQKSGVEYRN